MSHWIATFVVFALIFTIDANSFETQEKDFRFISFQGEFNMVMGIIANIPKILKNL